MGDGPPSFVFDGTYVWILNHRETTLDRIDPATNAGADGERMASFGGSLWVTGRGLDLLRLTA